LNSKSMKTQSRSERGVRYERLIEPAENRTEQVFWGSDEVWEPGQLREGADSKPVFDLRERTARFGEAIIRFAKKIPPSAVNSRLITQLVGAGTSIGANFCEADDGASTKDFKHKVGICRKESKETKYWLRMVAVAEPALKAEARLLWQEAKE